MTKEETLKRIEVMQAYCNGQQIQVLTPTNGWMNIDEPNWKGIDYRITPTSKYRPFSNMKECIQEIQKHPMPGWIRWSGNLENIAEINDTGFTFLDHQFYSYKDLLRSVYPTFVDGAPLGILNEN